VRTRRWLDEFGVLIGLALVLILFGLLIGPQFFRPTNLELMARQAAIVCVAAFGMTMIIVAGGIDLSVGSIVALATVVAAILLNAGLSPVTAALVTVFAGACCGLMNGALIVGLRVVPFIVTLGTMLLFRGAAKGLAGERRIEAPSTWLNELLRTADGGRGFILPSGIWLMLALAVLVGAVLRYTRFGRHLFAIGSNERTARLCGVRVHRCKLAVYAVIIGGGSLSGGQGSVLGTLAGAGIMTVIQIGCSQHGLPNWVQEIVTGAIIVGAVSLDRWRRRAGGAATT
jgi:ribose/xylose/arabinose/galactoside ABC-type transport system permease subunit